MGKPQKGLRSIFILFSIYTVVLSLTLSITLEGQAISEKQEAEADWEAETSREPETFGDSETLSEPEEQTSSESEEDDSFSEEYEELSEGISAEESEDTEPESRLEVFPRIESLGNWTNYNGIIFGNASIYDTTSGGGLAVGGLLNVYRDFTVGSTYSSEYDATLHIGEYSNSNRLPALLLGGSQMQIGSGVQSLDVYGGSIVMSPSMLEDNQNRETGFTPGTDSGYESLSQEELNAWFDYQHQVVSFTSHNLQEGNDVSISLNELSDESYFEYGPEYFKNRYFQVNGEVYEDALLITVRTNSDVNFGQWWPLSLINVDVNWALNYEIVVFNFPDAVNITMNSSAFQIKNLSHWSTTADAWVGETGMRERLALSEKVVYNFPNARSIEANRTLIQGTILAPEAAFTGSGWGDEGHIYGHIIARNYTAQSNFTIHAFHLTSRVYDLADEMIREEKETGTIRLRNYLYLHDETTSIRMSDGEYILLDRDRGFFDGNGYFTEDQAQAAVYSSNAEQDMVIENIPYGFYILRNIKAPEGCFINEEKKQNPYTYYETEVLLDETKKESVLLHYSEPVFTDVYFRKSDAETGEGIPGAKFAIVREADQYEDTTIGSLYTSNEDGTFVSSHLPIGIYRLIEAEVPVGYELLPDGQVQFEVFWDEDSRRLNVRDMNGLILEGSRENPVLIENQPGNEQNLLTIVKYAHREYESGILYTLPGAEYDLYFHSQPNEWIKITENTQGEPVVLTTNTLGYTRIQHLETGTYRLVETKAPDGYIADNPHTDEKTDVFPQGYTEEITFDGERTSHTVYSKNMAWTADIMLQLNGDILQNKTGIAGAAFRLEHRLQEENTWEEIFHSSLTDGGGQITMTSLEAGIYRLTQLSSGIGYQPLNPAVINFTLFFTDGMPSIEVLYNREIVGPDTYPVSSAIGEGIIMYIENIARTTSYGVFKIDADFTTDKDESGNTVYLVSYLENARFRLRRRTGIRSGWSDYGGTFTSVFQYDEDDTPVVDNYGNHVAQAIFDGGLPYGDYQLVETEAPKGYSISSGIEVTFEDGTSGRQIHLFTITENMTGPDKSMEYTASDYALDYSADLYFQMVDVNDYTLGLSDSWFALYQCDKEHIHNTGISEDSCWTESTPIIEKSDSKGIVEMAGLSSSSYLLVQTKASPGYRLAAGQWLIKVNAPEQSFDITPVNNDNTPSFIQITAENNVSYLLPSQKRLLLPITGGRGLILYIVCGTAMLAAAYVLYRFKRKER